jgi:CBS domain-containing protein
MVRQLLSIGGILSKQPREKAMRARDAMTHDVCIVRPDHTVEEAARMMAAIDVGLLPVGEGDRLIGMVTDRDIAVRAVAEGKGAATQVEQVMTLDVKYCYEDEDTGHITRNMAEQQLRRLPVLSRDKRLVGILSLADIAQFEAGVREVGNAYRGIAQPGGAHNTGEYVGE